MPRRRSVISLSLFLLVATAAVLVLVQVVRLQATRIPQYAKLTVGPAIESIAWSPDSSRLVAGIADGSLVSWNLDDHQRQVIASDHDQASWEVHWSPDGSLLAALSHRQLIIWNTSMWILVGEVNLNSRFGADPEPVVAWSAKDILSLGNVSYQSSRYQFQLETWDISSPNPIPIGELEGRNFPISDIEWSHQGDRLVIGSEVFDGRAFRKPLAILEAPNPLKSVAWSPDDSLIAAASLFDFGLVTICDSNTGEAVTELPEKMSTIETVSWSSNGNWLAAGGYWTRNGTNLGAYYPGKFDIDRGAIDVWDTHTWETVYSHTWADVPVNDVQFSPDNKFLAVALQNGEILLIDPGSGRQLDTLQ